MTKTMGSIGFSLVVAMGLLAPQTASSQILACDVNLSGAVDAVDVQLIINAALGLQVDAVYTNIDFDPSGEANAIDVQLVINAALGLTVDRDLDGLVDAAEGNLGTDPDVFDTDNGGVGDGQEVILDGTDPLDPNDDLVVGRPLPNFTAFPTSGVAPLSVQFTDTSTPGGGPITAWSWSFGDGNGSTDQNPVHIYQSPGVYTVTLVVTNQFATRSVIRTDFITVEDIAGIRWIGGVTGEWSNPDNWEGGQVPGENDTALVEETVPPATILVTSTTNVGNVFMNNNNLTVTGTNVILRARGTVTINGIFTLTEGARLEADRSTSNFEASGIVNINNHTVVVRTGAQVSFPNMSSYTFIGNANPTVFDVSGNSPAIEGSVPSRLLAPMLTTLTFNSDSGGGFRTLTMRADSNGELDLSGLTTVNTLGTNDSVLFQSNTGGSIMLDSLNTGADVNFSALGGTSMTLDGLTGAYTGTISVTGGGSLTMPLVTSLSNASVTVAGTLSIPNLTAASGTSLTFQGESSNAYPALTTITGGSITLRNTTTTVFGALTTLGNTNITLQEESELSLPLLTTYSPTATNNSLNVQNQATFNAPLLANINNLNIIVQAGAQLSLPLVTSYTFIGNANPFVFDATGTLPAAQGGTPSTLTLANLTTLTFNSDSGGGFRTLTARSRNSGILDLSGLTTVNSLGLNDTALFESNTDGQVLLTSLNDPSGYNLSALGGTTMTLGALTGAYTGTITVTGGGTMSMPQVTSLSNSSATVTGTLSIPNLTAVSGTSLTFQGSSSNAYPAVTTFTGGSITLRNTAMTAFGALTTLGNTNITLQEESELSLPLLTTYSPTATNNSLNVQNQATFNAPLLANINNLNIIVQAGAQLSLPLVTSYTFIGNANPFVFDATGALPAAQGGTPSTLTLANLTTLTFNSDSGGGFRTLTARSRNSGILDLSGLVTVNPQGLNDTVLFESNSDGQVLLTSLNDPSGYNLSALGGTTLTLDALTGAYTGTISVTGGGSLALPQVTSLSNASATVTGTLSIPNLTSLSSTSLTFLGSSSNAYPSVTTFTGGSMILRNTAMAEFENLTTLGNTNITLENEAQLSLPALTTYTPTATNISLNVQSQAVINVPLLANINNLNIIVQAGAQVSLPLVTTYTFIGNANPVPFDATGTLPAAQGGTPSTLTLANLISLTFNSDSGGGFRTLTVRGRTSGEVLMPLLASVTAVGANDSVVFRAETDGLVDITALDPIPAKVSLSVATGGTIVNPNAKSAAKDSAGAAYLVTDLSGDGLADHIDTSAAGSVTVALADGSVLTYAVGEDPVDLAAGDIDGDGLLDIVVVNRVSGDLSILYGAGGGALFAEEAIALGATPVSVTVEDTNGDGHADLVVTVVGEEAPVVLLGDGTGQFEAQE